MQPLILANLSALAILVALIYWFWSRNLKTPSLVNDDAIDILVANGCYSPSNIYLTVGKPATLRFFRSDPDPHAGTVTFQGFITNYHLPLNKSFELEFTPEEIGELSFKGQFDKYRGRIIVTDASVVSPQENPQPFTQPLPQNPPPLQDQPTLS